MLKDKIKNIEKQIKQLNDKVKKEKREINEDEKKKRDKWTKDRDELRKSLPPKYATAHGLRENGSNNMHCLLYTSPSPRDRG